MSLGGLGPAAQRSAAPERLCASPPERWFRYVWQTQVLAANVTGEAHPLLQRSDQCCNAERMDEAHCCRPHAMLWQVP